MKKNVQINVIIPVFNCEKYINEAVDSVLSQPVSGIQIILVDDGSTDTSAKICDDLSEKYDAVSVIHKRNHGVSSARNTGIQYVLDYYSSDLNGRYIAFLDADDAWEQGFLNEHVQSLLKGTYDLVGFMTCTCNSKMEKTGNPIQLQEGEYAGGTQNVWIHSSQSFASMFYSCKFLQQYDIRFREGLRYSEDKIFSLQCIYLADRIYQENTIMYLYRINRSSAMGKREFGILYYGPIVEAYLDLDRNVEKWANNKRGTLTAGHLCASQYIVCMMKEHFQHWRSKKQFDAFLEENPNYLAIINREPPYHFLPQNNEYEKFKKNTKTYILTQNLLGIGLWIRRCVGKFIKYFR